MVSIIPGIEKRAPERQETSNGFSMLPNFFPVWLSSAAIASSAWSQRPSGKRSPAAR